MATFIEYESSSDSEDDDYVPDINALSEEDDEDPLPPEKDDEIQTKKNSKKNSKAIDDKDEKTKISEKSPSAVDEKQRTNDLFKNFLEEVEAEMKMKESDGDSAYVSPGEVFKTPDSDVKSNEKTPEEPSSACKLFEFAGETISVSSEEKSASEFEKNSNVESKVSDDPKPSSELPVPKPKGLASVLNTIMNKKQKLTTLQKTSLDWNQFKREQGISEELESFNRGRGGYIERKRFLERSDLRSYEIERDQRMAKRKKN